MSHGKKTKKTIKHHVSKRHKKQSKFERDHDHEDSQEASVQDRDFAKPVLNLDLEAEKLFNAKTDNYTSPFKEMLSPAHIHNEWAVQCSLEIEQVSKLRSYYEALAQYKHKPAPLGSVFTDYYPINVSRRYTASATRDASVEPKIYDVLMENLLHERIHPSAWRMFARTMQTIRQEGESDSVITIDMLDKLNKQDNGKAFLQRVMLANVLVLGAAYSHNEIVRLSQKDPNYIGLGFKYSKDEEGVSGNPWKSLRWNHPSYWSSASKWLLNKRQGKPFKAIMVDVGVHGHWHFDDLEHAQIFASSLADLLDPISGVMFLPPLTIVSYCDLKLMPSENNGYDTKDRSEKEDELSITQSVKLVLQKTRLHGDSFIHQVTPHLLFYRGVNSQFIRLDQGYMVSRETEPKLPEFTHAVCDRWVLAKSHYISQ